MINKPKAKDVFIPKKPESRFELEKGMNAEDIIKLGKFDAYHETDLYKQSVKGFPNLKNFVENPPNYCDKSTVDIYHTLLRTLADFNHNGRFDRHRLSYLVEQYYDTANAFEKGNHKLVIDNQKELADILQNELDRSE